MAINMTSLFKIVVFGVITFVKVTRVKTTLGPQQFLIFKLKNSRKEYNTRL